MHNNIRELYRCADLERDWTVVFAFAVLVEVESGEHLCVELLARCRVGAIPLDVWDDAQQVVAAKAFKNMW